MTILFYFVCTIGASVSYFENDHTVSQTTITPQLTKVGLFTDGFAISRKMFLMKCEQTTCRIAPYTYIAKTHTNQI
jgi:hypothetical protein